MKNYVPMKNYASWIALLFLIAALLYGQKTQTMDQQVVQSCYQTLMPNAECFQPLNGNISTALDASGKPLGYVGVSSAVGYGGPMLVGVAVYPDGALGIPVVFSHRETPAYLSKIEQQGFFRQFEELRADSALSLGFDVDAVSGATLSSRAAALAVNEIAHDIAVQVLELTPQKAELPWNIAIQELIVAAFFVLSLMASKIKKLAQLRLFWLTLSVFILGFWLNRSFSLASFMATCMGFFPSIAQNFIWYMVLVGALLPPLLLGKNLYCTFVCPFCGVQEWTHKISHVNLPIGPLREIMHALRNVFLFLGLFIGFLSLNPSCSSYEPFGTIFGFNGANYNWYLLFIMLFASFFFHRFWCHVFCPAGALLDFVASTRRSVRKIGQPKKNSSPLTMPHENSASAIKPVAIPAMKKNSEQPNAQKLKITKSQILFLLFYLAGLLSIAWTVWLNVQA